MKRLLPVLAFLLLLAAPATAQQPRPTLPENAAEPLQQVVPDQFADDGEFDDDTWEEDWGEDPFSAEENEAWEQAAEESEHAEGHFDPLEFAAQTTNFLIWLAIVVFLARKPLAEYLKNRRLSVEEGLIEAKNLKEAAEASFADYSERLERLDEELEKLREEMIQAGETERDRILEDAEARAERMRRDARFIIEQQTKQLRTDMTREAIEAAESAAEKVFADQVKPADQTRLAQEYLEQLEATFADEEVRA